jgi:hypothetical protein
VTRRQVRATQSFFDRLDTLLPQERTADGTPSTADFLFREMPRIVDRLADDYERNTTVVPAAPGVRVLISRGVFVPFILVYSALAPDDAIDIIELELSFDDETDDGEAD